MNIIRVLSALLAAAFLIFSATSPATAQALRKNVANLTVAEQHGLRRGVAVMRSRDSAPRDSAEWRRSWQYWANVHAHFGPGCRGPVTGAGMSTIKEWEAGNAEETATWCTCEHGTAQFLTWHRMALFYFERVLQEAAGMPALRLPYWDVNAQPTLPPLFRARTYVNEFGQTVPNPLYVADRAPAINSGSAGISATARSASNALLATTYGTFRSRIENTPHGSVHCTLAAGGCPNGLMGSVPAAALDPIFWLHHANIDRIYECWLRRNEAARLPTGSTILNRQYSFVDADGSVVTRRVGDMLRTSQLGYRYTAGSDCPTTTADLSSEEPLFQARIEFPGAAEQLILAQAEDPGSKGRRIGWGERAQVRLPQAERRERRRSLRIRDVRYDLHPGVMYDVLLEGPNGVENVGLLSFFGDEHHAGPKDFDFDVTAALRSLGLRPQDTATVTFEPTTGLDTSTPEQAARQENPRANLGFEQLEVVAE